MSSDPNDSTLPFSQQVILARMFEAKAEFLLRGITLRAEHDKLIIDAPCGAVTAADREFLETYKPDLIMLLHRRASVHAQVEEAFSCISEDKRYNWDADTPRTATAHTLLDTAMHGFLLGRASWQTVNDAFQEYCRSHRI